MQRISDSVGRGGANRQSDVKIVQQLLNQHQIPGHPKPLKADGIIGPKTITRIEAFQKTILKMSRPDGRVDPNGKTLRILNQTASLSKPQNTHKISSKGMELLKSIERLRLKPYDDQTGKDISSWVEGATVGYGHLINRGEWNKYKNGISKREAEALFIQDLSPYANEVKSKVKTKLSQNEFDALVILTFNIGRGAFRTSSVLKLVNDPTAKTNYSSLEAAWKAWNKSQGKVMKGLNNRRQAEWDIYSKNIYKTW